MFKIIGVGVSWWLWVKDLALSLLWLWVIVVARVQSLAWETLAWPRHGPKKKKKCRILKDWTIKLSWVFVCLPLFLLFPFNCWNLLRARPWWLKSAVHTLLHMPVATSTSSFLGKTLGENDFKLIQGILGTGGSLVDVDSIWNRSRFCQDSLFPGS